MRGPALLFSITVLAAASSLTAEEGTGWPVYAHDEQHTCIGSGPSLIPQMIRWSTAVDLQPQYTGNDLFIHYGSPLITSRNTVILPLKTGVDDGFRVEAHRGSDGAVVWSLNTDFSLPPHEFEWVPICGIALTPGDHSVAVPGAGGTVILRNSPDSTGGEVKRLVFYGIENYNKDPAAFNASIQICTPISCDRHGNLYFGCVSTRSPLPGYPNGIPSGLARISKRGLGIFASA